uniref:NADH-ubiquinone oxidoreductase chain 3 n=1 Tax=Cerambycidae sp. 4 KM-2017 TaxID=2219289 RepID=A0A346RGA5_9CUCU|nr:NADH dehydrogenase subunit 3 [Cerambycidae sp. 4 KM-2017]
MKMLIILSLILAMINLILIIVLNLITKKSFSDREKSSPFECGFDPKNSARLPFSLHFFLIAIIFLIFDIEIALLLPLIISINWTNIMNYSLFSFFFILILIFGLYHEWKQGALNWTK